MKKHIKAQYNFAWNEKKPGVFLSNQKCTKFEPYSGRRQLYLVLLIDAKYSNGYFVSKIDSIDRSVSRTIMGKNKKRCKVCLSTFKKFAKKTCIGSKNCGWKELDFMLYMQLGMVFITTLATLFRSYFLSNLIDEPSTRSLLHCAIRKITNKIPLLKFLFWW